MEQSAQQSSMLVENCADIQHSTRSLSLADLVFAMLCNAAAYNHSLTSLPCKLALQGRNCSTTSLMLCMKHFSDRLQQHTAAFHGKAAQILKSVYKATADGQEPSLLSKLLVSSNCTAGRKRNRHRKAFWCMLRSTKVQVHAMICSPVG